MNVIFIGKNYDSIKSFTSLVSENEDYKLVKTYLYTDDYKEDILLYNINCVVIDLTVDDCLDIKFATYLRNIDQYVVVYGDEEMREFTINKLNNDLKYFDFLDKNSNEVKVNSYLSMLAKNVAEFNVSDFFDAYINDDQIVFNNDELERFVTYLVCRTKKLIPFEEIVDTLCPKDYSPIKKKMYFHQQCCSFSSFLDDIGLSYLFDYNQDYCIINYHLITSDFYQYLNGDFDELNMDYLKTFNCDFVELHQSNIDEQKIKFALDDEIEDEAYQDDYVPLMEEETDFTLVEDDEDIAVEESFLEKAMLGNKKN